MEIDEIYSGLIGRIQTALSPVPVDIPPELARPRSKLKLLDARHYNWSAAGFRKIFGMRFSLRVPPLEQLNVILYPRADSELPIFIFFCLQTRRKLIGHLNLICPFDDQEYRDRYIAPAVGRRSRAMKFEDTGRYPEWMETYRNEATIYGMYRREMSRELATLAFGYLDDYLAAAQKCLPSRSESDCDAIAAMHKHFVADIRTQDKAQAMMARMIGKQVARRIFHEVTT